MDDASATDNCGEVVITVDAVTTEGSCTVNTQSHVRSLLLMMW